MTTEAVRQPADAFAALTSRNYRIYISGQSLANIGAWMQSIAQDWLIFDLTHSSTAVGVTMALQFLPMLLLGLHAGMVADRLPKRRILLTTQTLNAAAAGTLAIITLSGTVHAADVFAFAFASGLIFAFDAPARQSFVAEVVPAGRLRAAIALNAATFQATRLIGPAVASLLIVTVGTGWVFAVNAACYIGPIVGLLRLRRSDLVPAPAAPRESGALRAAARYLRGRPDVAWTIFLVGVIGTFGLNFPIVLTAMAKSAFHGDASTYGLFNVVLAIGSAAGALLAGAGARPRPRIMGLYMLVFIGGTPIGAPIIGAITNHFGPRAGMAVCGVVPAMGAVVMAAALARRRREITGTAPAPLAPQAPATRRNRAFP